MAVSLLLMHSNNVTGDATIAKGTRRLLKDDLINSDMKICTVFVINAAGMNR